MHPQSEGDRMILPPLITEEIIALNEAQRMNYINNVRLKNTEPWTPDIPWKLQLNIKAESYHPLTLFDGLTPVEKVPPNPNDFLSGEFIESPNGSWRYAHLKLHKGHSLMTWYGSKFGSVVFDGDVIIPAVYEKVGGYFRQDPWMSFTPAEIMSFRGGIRAAKGRVVVAGLGLGHLLIEVSKKKSVKEIILVEVSKEIVDWLLPRIEYHMMKEKLVQVIIGDAYEELPKLTADVAVVDIFMNYGNNDRDVQELRQKSPNIKRLWGWGTARI